MLRLGLLGLRLEFKVRLNLGLQEGQGRYVDYTFRICSMCPHLVVSERSNTSSSSYFQSMNAKINIINPFSYNIISLLDLVDETSWAYVIEQIRK